MPKRLHYHAVVIHPEPEVRPARKSEGDAYLERETLRKAGAIAELRTGVDRSCGNCEKLKATARRRK